jgi:hypothetical protein
MKIAVVSDDFYSLCGSAGRARRFLIYEAKPGRRPRLAEYLQLPEHIPSLHELHGDDDSPHPIDGLTLIAAEAGAGFAERLAGRRTQVVITDEQDPLTAAVRLLAGELPSLPPSPHDPDRRQGDSPEAPPRSRADAGRAFMRDLGPF